ncbi:hypothetical protein ABIA31_007937 [Catenulispora sp. MAP5-51]|uniref:HvfC/BufC family peptide modification chaperone n=1 Tax=Catenulispora sp. MAP5-51 TaxID=3156298 RepID=UPI0035183B8C
MRATTRPHGGSIGAAFPADLAGLQLWLQTAIMNAAQDADDADQAAAVLTCSTRQTAQQRLAIYQRTYRLRLLGCLRSSFPALRHLLGHEAFDVLAAGYVEAVPPSSYTLDRFIQGFPAHLIEGRPDAERPAEQRDTWIDLVVDTARFERAFAEVYDAVEPDPCRLILCRYPVHTYAVAVARGHDPAPPTAQPVLLTLRRRGHTVAVTQKSPPDTGLSCTRPRTARARISM